MSEAVHDILDAFSDCPSAQHLELENVLAQQAEAEWQREAVEIRRLAHQEGIDQAAIDRAIAALRYGS